MSLAYLFRAYFENGAEFTAFEQTADDVARLDHDRKGSGSAYSDLVYLMEQGHRLAVFALCNLEGQPVAAVHLADGHFELCGSEFWAGDDGLGEGVARRLIYFRTVTRVRSQDFDTATGEERSDWREAVHIRYHLGWQATIDGRNVQHVIGIDG